MSTASAAAAVSDLRMTVERPHFTCERNGVAFSHVAAIVTQTAHKPLPCCDGQLGCAQFLSTNTILHGARQFHS